MMECESSSQGLHRRKYCRESSSHNVALKSMAEANK